MSRVALAFVACAALVAALTVHASGLHVTPQHPLKPSDAAAIPSWHALLKKQTRQLGLAADVTATLEETLFQKICATVLPLINQYVQGLVIPGESGKDFSFDNVVIQEFDIANLAIDMSAPSTIQVSLAQISFSIPQTHFDVWAWVIVKITCSGNFWASMTGTTITLSLDASESGGKLVFSNPQSNVQWGNLNINHNFPNFFCNVGQDIIQLFIGSINTLIKNLVENDLPAKIGPMVETALNTAMQKLPLDFVSQPVVTADSISLTVDLLDGAGVSKRTLVRPPQQPAHDRQLAPRDLELQVPQLAVDNLLLFVQQRGLLDVNITDPKLNTSLIKNIFPAVYNECPNCSFAVEVNMVNAPTVVFNNDSATVSLVNGILGLNINASNNGTILPFLDLYLNVTAGATQLSILANNSVYFQLAMQTISIGLRYSAIGPIDVALISDVIDVAVADILIPDFNKNFYGIALPPALQAAELAVADDSIFVAFDVTL